MFPIMLPTPPPVARSVELSDVVLSLKLLLVVLLDDIMKLKRRLLVDDDLEEDRAEHLSLSSSGSSTTLRTIRIVTHQH